MVEENEDIRWMQRLQNFEKAIAQLTKFVEKSELNDLEKQGIIQSFEYNYELSWNCIKDYYENQGEIDIQGSRDAFRLAFKRGMIENGDLWMGMVKSRALTTHTYNEDTAQVIVELIFNSYHKEFIMLRNRLVELKEKELGKK